MTSSEEDIDDGWDVIFMGRGSVNAYIYKGPSLSELKEFGRADGLFSKRIICRSWKTYGASQLRKLGIDGIVSLHWRFSIDDDPVPEWVSLLEFKQNFKYFDMSERIYIDLAIITETQKSKKRKRTTTPPTPPERTTPPTPPERTTPPTPPERATPPRVRLFVCPAKEKEKNYMSADYEVFSYDYSSLRRFVEEGEDFGSFLESLDTTKRYVKVPQRSMNGKAIRSRPFDTVGSSGRLIEVVNELKKNARDIVIVALKDADDDDITATAAVAATAAVVAPARNKTVLQKTIVLRGGIHYKDDPKTGAFVADPPRRDAKKFDFKYEMESDKSLFMEFARACFKEAGVRRIKNNAVIGIPRKRGSTKLDLVTTSNDLEKKLQSRNRSVIEVALVMDSDNDGNDMEGDDSDNDDEPQLASSQDATSRVADVERHLLLLKKSNTPITSEILSAAFKVGGAPKVVSRVVSTADRRRVSQSRPATLNKLVGLVDAVVRQLSATFSTEGVEYLSLQRSHIYVLATKLLPEEVRTKVIDGTVDSNVVLRSSLRPFIKDVASWENVEGVVTPEVATSGPSVSSLHPSSSKDHFERLITAIERQVAPSSSSASACIGSPASAAKVDFLMKKIELLERIKNPIPAIKQKLDELQTALAEIV